MSDHRFQIKDGDIWRDKATGDFARCFRYSAKYGDFESRIIETETGRVVVVFTTLGGDRTGIVQADRTIDFLNEQEIDK